MKKAAKKAAPTKKKAAPKPKAKKRVAKTTKTAKSVSKKAPPKGKKAVKKAPPARKGAAVKPKPPVKAKPRPSMKPVKRPTAPPPPPPAPPPPPPPATLPSSGEGTRENPWVLQTPSGGSEFSAYRDEEAEPPALVVKVGSTELRYQLRCITDLHEMLKARGDWMPLGAADEQQPVEEDTVEAWARSPGNPVGGWYGLKPGLRGRFATYVPPILEALGLAIVEHLPRNNRMRAK